MKTVHNRLHLSSTFCLVTNKELINNLLDVLKDMENAGMCSSCIAELLVGIAGIVQGELAASMPDEDFTELKQTLDEALVKNYHEAYEKHATIRAIKREQRKNGNTNPHE